MCIRDRTCINRFDDETKQAFLELYDKVDAEFNLDSAEDKMYEENGVTVFK